MENENFDESLKNHIKQLFEDCDDGHANEGWNLLREKYPAKNNRKYFFWWISAAVLLITALLLWLFQPEIIKVQLTKISNQTQSDLNKSKIQADSSFKVLTDKTDSLNINNTEKVVVKTVSKFHSNYKSIQHKRAVFIQNNKPTNLNNTVFIDTKSDLMENTNHQTQASDFAKADSVLPEKLQVNTQIQNPSTKPADKKESVKTVSNKKNKQKISKFGLNSYAGLHLNFANGSNTLLGFGAGVSTDFQLNRNLKLSTGLGLLQNKLSYQNKANNNFYASLPTNQATTSSTGTIINNTSLNSLDINLLQLDIPINLIYNILPGKNSISILAGLSSGTFVKESYRYNYTNAANDTQTSKSFQSFYLLKTLNVAAQFGLPMHKYNLQVEPFVKLPLGNLATQQLKFGAAGINLKFNFQSLKK